MFNYWENTDQNWEDQNQDENWEDISDVEITDDYSFINKLLKDYVNKNGVMYTELEYSMDFGTVESKIKFGLN